jgi:hypothetical protein
LQLQEEIVENLRMVDDQLICLKADIESTLNNRLNECDFRHLYLEQLECSFEGIMSLPGHAPRGRIIQRALCLIRRLKSLISGQIRKCKSFVTDLDGWQRVEFLSDANVCLIWEKEGFELMHKLMQHIEGKKKDYLNGNEGGEYNFHRRLKRVIKIVFENVLVGNQPPDVCELLTRPAEVIKHMCSDCMDDMIKEEVALTELSQRFYLAIHSFLRGDSPNKYDIELIVTTIATRGFSCSIKEDSVKVSCQHPPEWKSEESDLGLEVTIQHPIEHRRLVIRLHRLDKRAPLEPVACSVAKTFLDFPSWGKIYDSMPLPLSFKFPEKDE